MLREQDPDLLWLKVVDVIGEDRETVVNSALGSISDKKKEKIIELLLTFYNKDLCKTISDYLADQRIALKVSDINIDPD